MNGSPESKQSDEAGSIVAFAAVLMVALMAIAGLVVDGGRYLAARQAAMAEAEQAARAGASALDVSALRGGVVSVDPGAGVSAAQGYMSTTGHPGTATANGNSMTATVTRYEIPTTLLMLVGISHLTVSATASATDVHGVVRED